MTVIQTLGNLGTMLVRSTLFILLAVLLPVTAAIGKAIAFLIDTTAVAFVSCADHCPERIVGDGEVSGTLAATRASSPTDARRNSGKMKYARLHIQNRIVGR
jgi:hypothetical protein